MRVAIRDLRSNDEAHVAADNAVRNVRRRECRVIVLAKIVVR